MSSSIITFDKKYIDVNDLLLNIGLFYLNEFSKDKDLPYWLRKYFESTIFDIIAIQPVGFSDLELETIFYDIESQKIFINLINDFKYELPKKNIISSNEINDIMDFKHNKISYEIDICDVISIFDDILLLLDNNISITHPRLNIYQKPPYID